MPPGAVPIRPPQGQPCDRRSRCRIGGEAGGERAGVEDGEAAGGGEFVRVRRNSRRGRIARCQLAGEILHESCKDRWCEFMAR